MMSYLGDEVTASTVGKAEQWLYAFGNRLGVKPDKIIRSFTTDEISACLYLS